MSLLPYDTFLLHTSCHHHLFNMSIQPAVCTRELCVFSFYTLGVMSGAAEEVATGAEVWGMEELLGNWDHLWLGIPAVSLLGI